MTVELKKGYYIDSYYDKNTRSYITILKDEDGNQVRDAYYSGNMTDRNSDIQYLKEIFYDENRWEDFKSGSYDSTESSSNVREFLNSTDNEESLVEESLDSKIKYTKEKTKKAKLPALSTLSPIMPDAAAGISTFNSGVGLSEDYIGRDELIKRLKAMGYKYNYPKYTDQELYEIYKKNLKAQETKKELKKLKAAEKARKQRYKDKLSQVKYDEDSDTYSDGSYYKNGIEFESEEAAKEYFGESMDKFEKRNLEYDIGDEIHYIFRKYDAGNPRFYSVNIFDDRIQVEFRLDSYQERFLKGHLSEIKKALAAYGDGPVKQSSFRHPSLTFGDREITYIIPLKNDSEINESINNKKYRVGRKIARDRWVRPTVSKSELSKMAQQILDDNDILETITNNAIYDLGPKTANKVLAILNDNGINSEVITDNAGLCTIYLTESLDNKFYLNDMHKAWDIEEDSSVKTLNENLNSGHEFKTITEGLKYFERKEFNENCIDAELESLYEGIKNNLDQEDIKKLGNFLKKADSADDVATYIRGLLSEDVNNENFNDVTIGLYGGDETFPYPEDFYSFIDKCKKLGITVSNDSCDEYMNWEMDLTGNGYTIYKLCRNFPGYDNVEFSANDWIHEYRIDESLTEARKPKYVDSQFGRDVKDAMDNGELTYDNIKEWDRKYNGGIDPIPAFNTRELMNFYYMRPDYFDESLNESLDDVVKDAIEYYRENAFGYSSLKNYVETDFSHYPKDKQKEVYKKMKKILKESLNHLSNEDLKQIVLNCWDLCCNDEIEKIYIKENEISTHFKHYIPNDTEVQEFIRCLSRKIGPVKLKDRNSIFGGKGGYVTVILKHTYAESLNESYIEEWWGQTDEDPHELENFGLKVKELETKGDETLYRFEGRKTDIERAMDAGYFYSFEYGEDAGHSKDLEKTYDKLVDELLIELHKVGFELDDSVSKPIRNNIMGGRHIQVINPTLKYPSIETEGEDISEEEAYKLFKDDVKDIVYILDKFEEDNNIALTFNFGPNKDMIITGGIDIR